MLNELKVIADSLDAIGEGVDLLHRDIFLPGGKEALRIVLGSNATIDALEYMDEKQLANCWGLKTSNQDQFPCIKLTSPLRSKGNPLYSALWAFNSAKKKDAQKAEIKLIEQCKAESVDIDELKSLKGSKIPEFFLNKYPCCDEFLFSVWPKESYRESIQNRFNTLKNSRNENVRIVAELFNRYLKFGNNGIALLKQLDRMIEYMLKNGTVIHERLLLNVLFGEKKANKKGEIDSRSILVLDYKPSEKIDEFATARHRKSDISNYLNENSPTKTRMGVCFLTGKQGKIIDDKFPEKNLGKGKSVSKVTLFSKFDDNGGKPTVQRYYKSGAVSYCLDSDEASRLGEALVKITQERHKGKLWKSIPSEGKTQDLLIAFCRLPNVTAIPLLAGSDIDDIDDYINSAENVINSFNGSNLRFDEFVDFIVIRKIDDGNQKVIFSTTRTIRSLEESAKEWINACKNTPDFKLFAQIGKTTKLLNPWPIAPVKICYLSRLKYIRDGESSTSIPAISFSDTMRFFFSQNDDLSQLASRSLVRLSNQFEPLISHCALSKTHSVLGKKDARVKTNPKNNTQALNAVTAMSALLYKLGRKREVYMNDFAYQLGQLCSAVDELHIGYCKSMRGGDIPNTLIGNLTYGMALQSPTKALAVLASRIKPYETWARNPKNFSSDDKAIKAGIYAYKWLSGQYEKIYSHFADGNPSITDSFKAELMLGYLAGRPFEGKREQPDSNDTQGE